MTVASQICSSCRHRYEPSDGYGVCPKCGAIPTIAGDSHFDATLPYEGASAVLKPHPNDAEPDDLLDRELHVYRFESFLGAGAMGRVYLAVHQILQRKCALKILSPRVVCKEEDYVARFHNEGRSAAALIHPHIVTTHAIGEEDGFHFLEMEYIPGETLQQLIRREGPLTPLHATRLTLQIAEGLAAAHRANIIHGDLKLENVLLTTSGIPKIADFGLAKAVPAEAEATTHQLIGTPNYMAPEMFRGVPASKSTDVYALGVCYYLLLTGEQPFQGRTLAVLAKAIENDPYPNVRDRSPGVSLEMLECLSLLMSKAPANRPRDAIEAAQLLHAVLGELRDLESLLQEAFPDREYVCWSRTQEKYTLDIRLPDGRGQRVFMEPSSHRAAERLLLIYSICCPANPDFYEHALRLNSEISHGAIALRQIDGEDYFVMINTYPRGTIDPEEIRHSVIEVSFRADAIEQLITGEDRY